MATDISDSIVYIADDHPANRSLLARILARVGLHRVSEFGDGRQLLDAVEELEPDLILLDLRMPVVNGHEVLRRLEHRRQGEGFLPIIVLTADSTLEARRSALDGGAHDYLTKPFDAEEVVLRARNLLQTRRLHLALRAHNAELLGQVDAASRLLLSREREWADVALSLSKLEEKETAEATAQAICDELSRIPGLMAVTVTAIDAAGHAVPLAHDNRSDVRIGVNRALPRDLTDRWRERVGSKPWIGPWEPGFGSFMSRVPVDQPTAMAVIPLRTSKSVLGGLSAATPRPDGTAYLAERLPILESFGAIASALLARGIGDRQQRGVVRGEIKQILADGAYGPVFQPIVDLQTDRVIGFEALTRFADHTRPDRRFADAAAVGLGFELEIATLQAALEASRVLPDEAWLSVNVSPGLILESTRLAQAIAGTHRRLVLEITEHAAIEDYAALRSSLASLGHLIRYAVDDAGAGFSSFRHILELRPDFVKLDVALVRGVDSDHVRQALVAGIVHFGRQSGCRLVAEGIETAGERTVLSDLHVDFGQGFLLGRPATADTWANVASTPEVKGEQNQAS